MSSVQTVTTQLSDVLRHTAAGVLSLLYAELAKEDVGLIRGKERMTPPSSNSPCAEAPLWLPLIQQQPAATRDSRQMEEETVS